MYFISTKLYVLPFEGQQKTGKGHEKEPSVFLRFNIVVRAIVVFCRAPRCTI